MYLRRPHAHRLLYYGSPRRRSHLASSPEAAFKSPGSFRTKAASGRCLKLFAIIRRLPRMSARTTGRLSAEVCLDAGAIAGGALRKTGPAGIGPEDYGTYAARSLVQFSRPIPAGPVFRSNSSCFSSLIPPGFLRFPLAPQNRNAYNLHQIWVNGDSMSKARWSCGTAVVNGTIYLMC